MINKFENLSNEILLLILSNLTWFEMIESFWLLNQRFNSLICSTFSMNYDGNKNGIRINETGLSLNKLQLILSSIISNSSLSASIQQIHIDGSKSSLFFNIISQWIFQEKLIHFVNLKSIILIRCYLSNILINNLSLLVQYQLDHLTLTLNECTKEILYNIDHSTVNSHNLNHDQHAPDTCKHFIGQLFSSKSQLTSLRLDITNDGCDGQIHDYFLPIYNYSNQIDTKSIKNCITLRYLHINIIFGCFIEHVIEYLPNLEILSVAFRNSISTDFLHKMNMTQFVTMVSNWNDKVPKLKSFTLKGKILYDSQLIYLKSILNNVDHVEKLKLYVDIDLTYEKDSMKKNCVIDANFISQYLMPDISKNLVNFNFNIVSKCQLLSSYDIKMVEESFKTHQFFLHHHYINIKCFFDRIMSYQHISTIGIIKPKLFDGIM
ncbi:unnamed protein product [Rotaria sp. Silwood2]|nr:unnamed protein product [Rotaria sp. Silwood2]